MDAFEYRLLSVEQGAHGFVGQLNRMGQQGWEAVGQVDCLDEDAGVAEVRERVRYLLLKRAGQREDDGSTGPTDTAVLHRPTR